jgi:hypothetical protein
MRDQELILRFLALLHEGESYRPPMANFLNIYMGRNRELSDKDAAAMSARFRTTIDLVRESIGSRAFRPAKAMNAAVFDSVMVGTAKRLEIGPVLNIEAFRQAYAVLLNNQDFLDACGRWTADAGRVHARLNLAITAFASVP